VGKSPGVPARGNAALPRAETGCLETIYSGPGTGASVPTVFPFASGLGVQSLVRPGKKPPAWGRRLG